MLINPLGTNALLSEVLRYAPEYAIQNLMSEILEKVELAEELQEETDRLYSTIESLENELIYLRHGKGE